MILLRAELCPPQNSYVEALPLVFYMWLYAEIGALKRWLNKIEVIKVGPNPSWLVSLKEEEIRTRTVREKTMWGNEKAAIYTPGREASQETKAANTLLWTSSLQNCDK